MTRQTVIHCDRCGHNTSAKLEHTCAHVTMAINLEIDLCAACTDELRVWLGDKLTKEKARHEQAE